MPPDADRANPAGPRPPSTPTPTLAPMPRFCTYFDENYLVRGLALYHSLQRHLPACELTVLALDEACAAALRRLALPRLRIVTLDQLEAFDPALAATQGSRSRYEYFLTCTPCLMRYALLGEPGVEAVHYLDADLYFYADPSGLIDDFAGWSVAIIPHRFPAHLARELSAAGHYNVGWVSIRRDADGLACVDWWRARCLEWCYDRVEPTRFGDQKYLDEFPQRFAGVLVIGHPGANLAPWNVARHRVSRAANGRLEVDGRPLLFFHFSALRRLGGRWYASNQQVRSRQTAVTRNHVYRPYLRELLAIEERLRRSGIAVGHLRARPRGAPGFWRKGWRRRLFNQTLGLGVAALHGNLIRL